ncbi:MAG: hypothetical protein WC506_03385 [Candidatus Micrarchaeia archaeon]
MAYMRGQGSTEFLYAAIFSLLFFTIAIIVYVQSQNDANALYASASLQRVCIALASQVSAVSAAGDGTGAAIDLPEFQNGVAYGIFVNGSASGISVYSGNRTQGCRMTTMLVSNGTAAAFPATNFTRIENRGGTVYFEA